jgi:hypothetical protein
MGHNWVVFLGEFVPSMALVFGIQIVMLGIIDFGMVVVVGVLLFLFMP